MRRKTLEALMDGEFICPVAFPIEYEDLLDEEIRQEVGRWLEPIGKRLARVHEQGAFYMAPDMIGPEEIKQVREEMKAYRDIYGPALVVMDLIRQTDPDGIVLEPGEYLHAGKMETALGSNPALETQLNGLVGNIRRFVLKNTIRDRLDAVLDQMTAEGFLIKVERDKATYRVTGKVEQLWAVTEFIEQHEPIARGEVGGDEQDDLVDGAVE